jgi:selenide,water dikinase
MQDDLSPIALTKYAHGAGCGCKIAPQVLKEILAGDNLQPPDEKLLVGNNSNDDAAVYQLDNDMSLIATTDFFMPIVDDAFDFGRVAAANAISDVYAMGGRPILALAVLGWPVDKLPATLARKVIEGARAICAEAGIPLAGGHSIDTPEPVFGLAVNGLIETRNLKRNNTAREGDLIFMTKPIGTGIISTAQKRGLASPDDLKFLVDQMTTLNTIGGHLGKLESVTAMTDITGFGLLGHLLEMAEGSGLTAEISYTRVPKIQSLNTYLAQQIVPDATYRNWNAFSSKVHFEGEVNVMEAFQVLPDPQTNGGLLFCVAHDKEDQVAKLLSNYGLDQYTRPIGRMVAKSETPVKVEK